ncbi:alpha-2-macroglobulin-like protein 1 isoform X2 [Pseudophryne corroboree]|uniref:alpha-2-macroglobulin-like protein 1 isoform X2 n=1 Tax=Pseudophryne corroboree TaxID=495146 RepID=UPI003081CD35
MQPPPGDLQDPKGNIIYQWLNVQTATCIADLSFQLSNDPILGIYTINVENGLASQTFVVNEEVLPRFDVTIENPSVIFAADPSFTLRVCARYTYGRGVHGNVIATLCRQANWQNVAACTTVTGVTDVTGCLNALVNTSIFNLTGSEYFDYNVDVNADVKEIGTGVNFTVSQIIPISFSAGMLSFVEMDFYYKAGHQYKITLVVQDRNGAPLKFTKASVGVTIDGKDEYKIYGKTDKNGRIMFNLDTGKWIGRVTIQGYADNLFKGGPAVPSYINVIQQDVIPYYSEAKSFLQLVPVFGVIPCKSTVNIRVVYDISLQDLDRDDLFVKFYYIVIGKDGILLHGIRKITVQEQQSYAGAPSARRPPGILTIPIAFTPAFGTAPKMLGFLLLKNKTVAADRLMFNAEMCFPNKATLKFSQSVAIPKDQISLHLESSQGSMCALRAVDKSVQISYEDKELTKESLFGLFQYSIRGGYPDSVQEGQSFPCWGPFPFMKFRPFYIPYQNDFVDVFSLFKEIGVKVLTNTQIVKPEVVLPPCLFFEKFNLGGEGEVLPMLQNGPSESASNDVVRKYFPETWLWKLIPTGVSGQSTIPVTVPDTITQFNAGIFCIGNLGFGLSPQVSLTVFLSFFVELALPYSIVLGETFSLKALVFNYLAQCLMVQVTLSPSSHFTAVSCNGCPKSLCICANQTVTFSWDFTAKDLGLVDITVTAEAVSSTDTCSGQKPYVPPSGKIDILQRQLLVKPGGIRKEETQNMFYCLKASNKDITSTFSVIITTAWVKQSESASIYVMGDILGSTLQNLDQLITMPYGCGEQNMLTMAPIIYVLDYLKSTNQLGQALKDKAIGYMQNGYQRELSYKHSDGSYSAFGESDGAGNTWLTAFVMKCFYQAKNYIFIDGNVLNQAVSWLAAHQQTDGCFMNSGTLIHTLMKGGVEDDLSLDAYITAALLERGLPVNDQLLSNALSCLRGKVNGSVTTYTMALLAYTFALANDSTVTQQLLDKLFPLAVSSGGDLHWEYNLQSSTVSAAVELSAYVLLAMITGPSVSTATILTASKIVTWLIKQQNSNGGFSSTQDTVVAIQALAKYTRITFVPEANVLVKVSIGQESIKQFTVNTTNRLLLQTAQLPNIPGEYNLLITGSGCVYIQVVLKYNVMPVATKSAFSISANIENCGNEDEALVLHLSVR